MGRKKQKLGGNRKAGKKSKKNTTSSPAKPTRPKGRNSQYRNYDVSDVERAFKEVTEKKSSIRSAALQHGIPESTLRDRITGRVKLSTTQSGPCPFMPKSDEKIFVKHMLKLKAMGYRYRHSDIANAAADYGHYYGKRDIADGPMSRGWIRKFVERQSKKITYKEYHFRAQCPFPPIPVQAKYYDELENILAKYKLIDKPHLVYNLSETALYTSKRDDSDEEEEPEATLFSCVSAVGMTLPPFYIFKGTKPNAKLTKGGPDGLGAVMSETGCPNSRIMQHYLKDHFLKHLDAEDDDDTHALLLYDGHKSRILFPVIKWALEHKIVLFVIPPHCSFTVEPYLVANFNSMETCFQKECEAFSLKHDERPVDRYNICRIAGRAHEKSLTAAAIMASFHESGINPFKRKLVQTPNEREPQETSAGRKKRKRKVMHRGNTKKIKASREAQESDSESLSDSDEIEAEMSDESESDSDSSRTFNLSQNWPKLTQDDHSYGVVNQSHDGQGVLQAEADARQIIAEVLARNAAGSHNGSMTSSQTESLVETAATANTCLLEVPIEPAEVHIADKSEAEFEEMASSEQADGRSVFTVSNTGTDVLYVAQDESSTKHEYVLIKPKVKEEQCRSTEESTELNGKLIPLFKKDPGVSSDIDNKNMVIKVVEVDPETYKQIVDGGNVVFTESDDID